MSNGQANTSSERKHSNGALIFRKLNKTHEADPLRTYTILYDIEEPQMELKFSKSLSVNSVMRLLKLFIEDLRHEGFETPYMLIEVEPTEEEGVCKVPEGFSMPER
jgi:hypothetical protein